MAWSPTWVVGALKERYGSFGLEQLGGVAAVESRLAEGATAFTLLAALGAEIEEALGKPA